MNRAEATRQVLLLEAAAAQIKERAKALRADLDADARAELAEQGTAPTWRLDIGTWSLPVSKETVYVSDEAALLAWVKSDAVAADHVVETVERVRPWFVAELLKLVRIVDGQVTDDIGTIVPGLAVRPGGQPQTLRFRPADDAQAVADQHAAQLVKEVTAGLGIGEPS